MKSGISSKSKCLGAVRALCLLLLVVHLPTGDALVPIPEGAIPGEARSLLEDAMPVAPPAGNSTVLVGSIEEFYQALTNPAVDTILFSGQLTLSRKLWFQNWFQNNGPVVISDRRVTIASADVGYAAVLDFGRIPGALTIANGTSLTLQNMVLQGEAYTTDGDFGVKEWISGWYLSGLNAVASPSGLPDSQFTLVNVTHFFPGNCLDFFDNATLQYWQKQYNVSKENLIVHNNQTSVLMLGSYNSIDSIVNQQTGLATGKVKIAYQGFLDYMCVRSSTNNVTPVARLPTLPIGIPSDWSSALVTTSTELRAALLAEFVSTIYVSGIIKLNPSEWFPGRQRAKGRWVTLTSPAVGQPGVLDFAGIPAAIALTDEVQVTFRNIVLKGMASRESTPLNVTVVASNILGYSLAVNISRDNMSSAGAAIILYPRVTLANASLLLPQANCSGYNVSFVQQAFPASVVPAVRQTNLKTVLLNGAYSLFLPALNTTGAYKVELRLLNEVGFVCFEPGDALAHSSHERPLGLLVGVGLTCGLVAVALAIAAALTVRARRRRRQAAAAQVKVNQGVGGQPGTIMSPFQTFVPSSWPVEDSARQGQLSTARRVARKLQAALPWATTAPAAARAGANSRQAVELRGAPASQTAAAADALDQDSHSSQLQEGSSMGVHEGSSSRFDSMELVELPFNDMQILPEELEFCRHPDGQEWVLGKSSLSKVVKAVRNGVQTVAVKVYSSDVANHRSLEFFRREVSVLKACRDRNIVQFLGVCVEEGRTMLVLEFMENGDLYSALGRDNSGRLHWVGQHGLGLGSRIALHAARGLAFLHSHKIVHMDLKTPNILLDVDCNAKIADVGMAKVLYNSAVSSLHESGTFAWAAPEVLMGLRVTEKADMYSYGVVLWELCTGEVPVRGAMRPVRVPQECPGEVAELLEQCMEFEPHKRPGARQVVERLQEIASRRTAGLLRSMSGPAWNGLRQPQRGPGWLPAARAWSGGVDKELEEEGPELKA